MDYVNLGRSGVKVSRICLGCMSYGAPEWRDWILGEEDSRPFIQRALEMGINFFDTADIALAWLLHQPGVTAPIIGATRMEHLEDAVAALEIRLDEEERKSLEEPYRPHRVLGHE